MSNDPLNHQDASQKAVLDVLMKYKLVAELVHKQNLPRQDLIESLARKENLVRLGQILNQIQPTDIARIIDALSVDDQFFVWGNLNDARKESVLQAAPDSIVQLLEKKGFQTEKNHVKAFYLESGRLRETVITTRQNLLATKPIWIDLVEPSFEDRFWVGNIFGIKLPDPEKLSDLEASAKFYLEERGEIHLHSDFLLDKDDISNNVPVAFVLYEETLFSIRSVDLPIFRLQRLRALTQPNYVEDALDMLLDLYAGSIEYSADALEDVYRRLEFSGKQVLRKQITDQEAAEILTDIAYEEDLNGRIRRNVLDTRRAISFLMRSKILSKTQLGDSKQILRDIESLDGHTAFLFDKINFLMDSTVGFININQNQVVKRLTRISVVFLPLNVLAGIGGMSEFSMMTQGIPWPIAYGLFTLGLVILGWLTFTAIQFLENYQAKPISKNKPR